MTAGVSKHQFPSDKKVCSENILRDNLIINKPSATVACRKHFTEGDLPDVISRKCDQKLCLLSLINIVCGSLAPHHPTKWKAESSASRQCGNAAFVRPLAFGFAALLAPCVNLLDGTAARETCLLAE